MPNGHECKDKPNVPDLIFGPSKRNENIPNEPLIKTSMPRSPESFKTIVIKYTPIHIFCRINT